MASIGKPYNFDKDLEPGCAVQRAAGRALNAEPGCGEGRDLAAAGYLLYFSGPASSTHILTGMLEAAVEAGDAKAVRALSAAIAVL